MNVTIDIQKGDRVRLVSTSDRYTELGTGDLGTVHVKWDSGSALGLVPGEDSWVIL